MAGINTGSIAKALLPGVMNFYGLGYDQLAEEYSQIFDTQTSMKNFEEDVNVYGFGLASVKPESMDLAYDTMQQGFVKRYVHAVYALGYTISKEAVDDNQYPDLVVKRSKSMGNSMRQTKENVCALILARAFSNTYTGADGIELCSTAHLMSKGGTFSNKLAVDADLSEASLEQALIQIRGYTDDAGLRISAKGMKLIIPIQLEYEAQRILKSDLKYDTAENALNAMKSLGKLPGGIVVNTYLSDANAWFIKTSVPDGLKFLQRSPLEISNDTDFNSKNMRFSAMERYCAGWTDPRGVFGSAGSN